MWIDAGSRAETDKTNGTAHFLEHLAFKVIAIGLWCDTMDTDGDAGHEQALSAPIGAGDREHGWSPQRVHLGMGSGTPWKDFFRDANRPL